MVEPGEVVDERLHQLIFVPTELITRLPEGESAGRNKLTELCNNTLCNNTNVSGGHESRTKDNSEVLRGHPVGLLVLGHFEQVVYQELERVELRPRQLVYYVLQQSATCG